MHLQRQEYKQEVHCGNNSFCSNMNHLSMYGWELHTFVKEPRQTDDGKYAEPMYTAVYSRHVPLWKAFVNEMRRRRALKAIEVSYEKKKEASIARKAAFRQM